ncbi:MAG: hypothetical protein M0R03_08360 [Novosphingobium sp.]|nr:hypothetical protein [Novosphingobium sp.]
MPFARTLAGFSAVAVAAAVSPAVAQEAWNVQTGASGASIQIGQVAEDGSATLTASCENGKPGVTGTLSGYAGADLQRVNGQAERAIIFVEGAEWRDAFTLQLRYAAAAGQWQLARLLSPVFLDSFARGGRMVLVNSKWQDVAAFGLTGSANAAKAMREACGF